MNDEARLLFSLWESVQDFIPQGSRNEAAAMMIRTLIDQGGHDIDLLHDAEGECPNLDKGLETVADELADESDDLYDDLEDEE